MKANIKFLLALENTKFVVMQDDKSPVFYVKTKDNNSIFKQSINKIAKLLISR